MDARARPSGLLPPPAAEVTGRPRYAGPAAAQSRKEICPVTQTTGTPSTLSLSRIGQIAVRVHDLDRAIPFYRDTLGIPFLFRAGSLAFLDCSGTRLFLGTPEDREFDHPSSTIYFTVDD